MYQRSRSGNRVATAPKGLDVNLQQVVSLRIGAFAGALGGVTSLGLFFVADLRDPATWLFVLLATVFGVPGFAFWGRALVRRTSSESPPVSDAQSEPPAVAQPPPGEPETNLEPDSRAELDEVDYLMALRHEFRTPLNAVLGFSDVLLSGIDGEVNESQREDLEIIRASGIRLRILLDSALDLSQLAEGSLRLDREQVDVRDLLSRVAAEAEQLWSNKRCASCVLPEGPCLAEVDEARLRRSVLVLLEFLGTDHRDAEISIRLDPGEEFLAVEIAAASTDRLTLDALPTPAEVLGSEDPTKIRRWPVAVTSEVIVRHGGALYHGDAPSRFRIRLPMRASQ